jgi:hypothetical protein
MTDFIIVLILRDDDDDGSLRFCVLNESYSLAFNDDDLSEINSGSVQYKMKFKKENRGPICHSLELQKQ